MPRKFLFACAWMMTGTSLLQSCKRALWSLEMKSSASRMLYSCFHPSYILFINNSISGAVSQVPYLGRMLLVLNLYFPLISVMIIISSLFLTKHAPMLPRYVSLCFSQYLFPSVFPNLLQLSFQIKWPKHFSCCILIADKMLPCNLNNCKEYTPVSITILPYHFWYAFIYGYNTYYIVLSCIGMQLCADMYKNVQICVKAAI